MAEADGNRTRRRGGVRRPAVEIGLRAGRVRRSAAEADGNRTRRAGVARPTGFEDREGHQSPFASPWAAVTAGGLAPAPAT